MKIPGKAISLRLIEPSDAEFILKLRLTDLTKYMNPVDDDLQAQREWIASRLKVPNEYYFIVLNKADEPVGTIRIYEVVGKTFTWGSWIIRPDARKYATLESVILMYDFAFSELKYEMGTFDIHVENFLTINFNVNMGAKKTAQNGPLLHFEFTKQDYLKVRDALIARRDRLLASM